VPLFGGAGSSCNKMWPRSRPTIVPSYILFHPTVWPQYTNVTDRQTRQTERQRSDSIGRTVLQTVAPKRFALCYRTVVLSVLSATLMYCGQTVGWIKMKLGMKVGLIVLDGDPALPKGAQPPIFGPLLWPNRVDHDATW